MSFEVEGIDVIKKKVIFKIIKVHDVMKNKPLNEAFIRAMFISKLKTFTHKHQEHTLMQTPGEETYMYIYPA